MDSLHPSWVFSLPENVSIATSGHDGLVIASPFAKLELKRFGRARREALCQLAYPGQPLKQLIRIVESDGGRSEDRIRLLNDLHKLLRHRLLQFHVASEDRQLATLAPMSELFQPCGARVPNGRFMLSRFAYMRSHVDRMLLESPLSAARVLLSDPMATSFVHALSTPVCMDSLWSDDMTPATIESLVCLLNSAEMLTSVNEHDQREEDGRSGLKYWDFHDLLFHVRSRTGRHDQVVGAAYHWFGTADSPPAIKPIDTADFITLYRPDIEQLEQSDPTLAHVVEERCSVREYGDVPITADQLGEFLFRVGRVRDLFEIDADTHVGTIHMEFSTRPFPSAGGLYELELYPLIRRCSGLDPGLYYYDPRKHGLLPVSGAHPYCDQLLTSAAMAAGVDDQQLQVVMIISARFPRVMWKYASMAYAAILKNVGVVYQTMYLTATAMKLAPCGLGTGDSDLFSRAIASDYYEETSVGELLLGSLPPGGPIPWNANPASGGT